MYACVYIYRQKMKAILGNIIKYSCIINISIHTQTHTHTHTETEDESHLG